jgi:hypothetical protein
VNNIPGSMTISSPGWVAHSITVAKIEIISPGSSRDMTYDQVQSYADLVPIDQLLDKVKGVLADRLKAPRR